MSLARLRALLEAYGANPDHWPPEERDAALSLLAQSPEAQRWREASARLDGLLGHSPAHEGSPALLERIVTAAAAGGVTAMRTRPMDARIARRVRARWALGAAIPLAAAAALLLWVLTEPSQRPEHTNITLAEIGTYHAPTDALLDVPSVQALDRIPSFGCAGTGLGCLETGALNDDTRSALDSEKRV